MYWAEAINMAAYIVNRIPCTRLADRETKTPEETFSGKRCDLSDLKLFGTKVMVLKPKQKRAKWDENSTKMIFVGFDECVKGFRCVDTSTKKVVVSRNVKFINELAKAEPKVTIDISAEPEIQKSESVKKDIKTDNTVNESSNEEMNVSTIGELNTHPAKIEERRASSRTRKQVEPFQIGHFAFLVELGSENEPKSITEAKNDKNCDKWITAMDEEIEAHKTNGTWELADLPNGRKAITAKWVFKLKGPGTENERFKARLVARGYAQVHGIDYDETFSPVVRHTSLRILFALSVNVGYQIYQMDAVTAFLQSELQETIYMKQPEGYADGSDRVCLLKKSIYGLKQAGRQWNLKLNDVLQKYGLQRSKFDPCVYLNGKLTLLIAVYVDDFLIFYKNENELNELKLFLNSKLKMKEIGEAKECIGIHINKTHDVIELSQQKYIDDVLKRFDMLNCKTAKTPGEVNEKLSARMVNEGNDLTGKVPYQELVGSLLYIAQITRPDIAFCVNNVSRFNSKHSIEHWEAVLRILRYLKNTSNYVLRFKKDEKRDVFAFSDADYASEIDKRRSCTGFVVKMAGAAISWHSKRQEIVAVSSTEAEYIALSTTVKEMLWVAQFVREVSNINIQPANIFCDNTSTIKLATSDAYRERTKHIDVRYHHIRDAVEKGKITVEFISTNDMVADALTKALNGTKTKQFADLMGLK